MCLSWVNQKALKTARYIHGELWEKANGHFMGGHDPEDYRHFVNDPPTDLNLYPNSPGYLVNFELIYCSPLLKRKNKKT